MMLAAAGRGAGGRREDRSSVDLSTCPVQCQPRTGHGPASGPRDGLQPPTRPSMSTHVAHTPKSKNPGRTGERRDRETARAGPVWRGASGAAERRGKGVLYGRAALRPPPVGGLARSCCVLRAAAGVRAARAAREGELSGVIHRLLLLRRCAACGCHHRAISHYFIPFHPSSAVGGSTLASSPQHKHTTTTAPLPPTTLAVPRLSSQRPRNPRKFLASNAPDRVPPSPPLPTRHGAPFTASLPPSGVGAPRLVSSSTTPTPSHRLQSAPRDLQSPLRPPPAHNTLSPRSLGLTATTHPGASPFHHAGSYSTRS